MPETDLEAGYIHQRWRCWQLGWRHQRFVMPHQRVHLCLKCRKKKKYLTVDVADGGNDDTVVKVWENKTEKRCERFPGKRADEVYADVWRICKEENANTIIYDNDGVGRVLGGLLRGVVDKNIDIISFDGSGEPLDDTDFYNRRAEAHFLMFKDFRDNQLSILKGNTNQKEEITSVQWGRPKNGKMIVETKKELKERIGRSPDDGDCVMMMSGCYEQVRFINEADNMYVYRNRAKNKSWQAA